MSLRLFLPYLIDYASNRLDDVSVDFYNDGPATKHFPGFACLAKKTSSFSLEETVFWRASQQSTASWPKAILLGQTERSYYATFGSVTSFQYRVRFAVGQVAVHALIPIPDREVPPEGSALESTDRAPLPAQ